MYSTDMMMTGVGTDMEGVLMPGRDLRRLSERDTDGCGP